MIANGWKTAKQIQADYQISKSNFYRLKDKCLASSFNDALVLVGDKTYVVENRWQDFLMYLSQKQKAEKYGARTERRIKAYG